LVIGHFINTVSEQISKEFEIVTCHLYSFLRSKIKILLFAHTHLDYGHIILQKSISTQNYVFQASGFINAYIILFAGVIKEYLTPQVLTAIYFEFFE